MNNAAKTRTHSIPRIWSYNGGLSGRSESGTANVLDKAKAAWQRNGCHGTVTVSFEDRGTSYVWEAKGYVG